MSFGFTFNGRHSKEFDISVTNVERPILPAVQSKTVTFPSAHGAHYFGSNFDPLEITVEVVFSEVSLNRLQIAKRNIAAWLSPVQGITDLILDDEPDKKYRAVVSGETSLEQILAIGRGEITFLAPDPFAYAVDDEEFTYTARGTFNFLRLGTAESFPLISVTGNMAADAVLRVTLNGTAVAFTGELAENQELLIDCALKTASILENGSESRSAINQLDDLRFPIAVPGNNELIISSSGEVRINKITISPRSRWI